MAKTKPTKMLAVLGRSRRGGRWSLAPRSSVLAFLGTCQLDMRRSSVDGEMFKMKVTVVLGSATFVLPPGAVVKPSGLTVLAGSLVDVPESEETCDLPTLEIEWTTVLGRIHVITRSLDDDDLDENNPEDAANERLGPGAEPIETVLHRARPEIVAEVVEAEDEPVRTEPSVLSPTTDGISSADEAPERTEADDDGATDPDQANDLPAANGDDADQAADATAQDRSLSTADQPDVDVSDKPTDQPDVTDQGDATDQPAPGDADDSPDQPDVGEVPDDVVAAVATAVEAGVQ